MEKVHKAEKLAMGLKSTCPPEKKKLAKQIKLEEKKQIKKNKKSSITNVDDKNAKQLKKEEINLNEFSEIVKKITRKNAFIPYPDINDMPN